MTSGIIMREKGKNKKDVVIETSLISPMTFLTKSVKSRSRTIARLDLYGFCIEVDVVQFYIICAVFVHDFL